MLYCEVRDKNKGKLAELHRENRTLSLQEWRIVLSDGGFDYHQTLSGQALNIRIK